MATVGAANMYSNLMARYPYSMNIMQSSSVMGGADAVAQKSSGRTTKKRYDVTRGASMVGWVAMCSTPFYLMVWRYIDKKWPSRALKAAAAKGIGSQVLLGLPVNAGFIAFTTAMHAKLNNNDIDAPAIARKIVDTSPSVWMNGTAYWGTLNTINFAYVPPAYRFLFMTACSAVWMTYLASVQAPGSPKSDTTTD